MILCGVGSVIGSVCLKLWLQKTQYWADNSYIREQFHKGILLIGSFHKFAHGTTCQLLWQVPIYYLFGSLKSEQREFSRDLNYKLINCLWNGPQGSGLQKISKFLFKSSNSKYDSLQFQYENLITIHFCRCLDNSVIGAFGKRDPSVCEPSQWEMALHYNSVSLWLGVCTEWSLGKRF